MTAAPDGRPVVVLAVESPTVQRVLASVLGRAGYAVTAVADGVAAAQVATAGPADCVLAAADMPRLTGFALVRLLREDPRTAHLPLLLLTAPGAAAEPHWATLCGADGTLPFDVETHDLVAAVGAALAAAPSAGAELPRGLRDPDDVVLARASEVLERALFETALVAEVTGLATAGLGAEGALAGLLTTVARVVDPALAVVLTPDPPLAFVLANRPTSLAHYRHLLLRACADMATSTGRPVDAAAVDARAADPGRLLGADDRADLAQYQAVVLAGADGRYVGQLAVSSGGGGFPARAVRTLTLLAHPAGRLVDTVTGKTER